LDELSKLEEKLDKLISLVSELKHKVEDYREKNDVLTTRDQKVKEKVEMLIEKIDNLLI
jgi:FtsZ-binding cell division protein ZapB